MNLQEMSIEQIRELTQQLDVIKKAGLAKYAKGELIVEDITVNKGGGISLRFKGSKFPVNMYGSQLAEIVKYSEQIVSKCKTLGVSLLPTK